LICQRLYFSLDLKQVQSFIEVKMTFQKRQDGGRRMRLQLLPRLGGAVVRKGKH
jgi:hypothetical protein